MRDITGIDVSDNNGEINWDAVKASGITHAYIRVGYGSNYASQDDKQAERNMCECERLDIPYGVYLYSYALSEDDSRSEYEHLKRMVANHNPILGVAYDMEDADAYKANHGLYPYSNATLLTNFCSIFAEKAQEDGYMPVTYANRDYFTNIVDMSRIPGRMWLAQWYANNGAADHPNIGEMVWQYSSDGAVPGSSARTDMNYFVDEELFDSLTAGNVSDAGQDKQEPILERHIEDVGTKHHVGDHVTYNRIFFESGDWTDGATPYYTDGVITDIYKGSRHPYLINNGTGFVDDNCITGFYGEPTEEPVEESSSGLRHSEGDYVSYSSIYESSTSGEALTPWITEGVITKVFPGTSNPYLINGGTGFVNDDCINEAEAPAEAPAEEPAQSGYAHGVGDHVSYNRIYGSSDDSSEGSTPYFTEGDITDVIKGAAHPYLIGDGTGYIDDGCITG